MRTTEPNHAAIDAAHAAHPETSRTGVVRPGHDGVPVFITTSSSNVQAIGFADGALFVLFTRGKVYRYTAKEQPAPAAPVDMAALHAGMMTAASKGSYFAQHLRRNAAVDCVYLGRCDDPIAPPVEHHENGDGC